jgi:REP-associated tyrosine transposase
MPEHIHLLLGEPKIANPSRVMQVLKQRVSLQCRATKRASTKQLSMFSERLPRAFWQPRSHDFNVRTKKKYFEKLKYIHMNPVRRGLVNSPEIWPWSSFRHYRYGEEGPVKVGE